MLPKHVKRVRSKGRNYYYFDTGKMDDGKRVYVRLPDLRSMDFGGSYAALMGHRNRKPKSDAMRVPKLIELYQKSPAYRELAPNSQRLYDIYLARFEKLMPTAPIAEITRGDIIKLLDGMAETPGAANSLLKSIGTVFAWAHTREYIRANPCDGIKRFAGGEHMPWPPHVLHAALTSEDGMVRLLTHMLYFTAQRLNDVLAMTWRDFIDGSVHVRQKKTGKVLVIPMHARLRRELDDTQRTALVVCTSKTGRPLKEDTARKALKDFCAAQGATCVPHGLRKNAVIALLEAGCSMAETAAISGQTLQVVEHYAKHRNQLQLASAAIVNWERKEA